MDKTFYGKQGASELKQYELRELKREYGDKELFRMLAARARLEPSEVLESRGMDAQEARALVTEPQAELFSFDHDTTSESLAELVIGILRIKDGERVADLCCGSGAFLMRAARETPGVSFRGIELDEWLAEAARTRLSLVAPGRAEISSGDVFEAPEEKYDKIYCEPPIGLRFNEERRGADFMLRELPWIKTLRRASHISGCWSYVCKVISSLKEGGRAVCVMAGGPLWNSFDAPVRGHLVREGLIEAVVSLPGGMTSYPAPSVTLVVIKRGCDGVIMADASGMEASGRRRKKLGREQIDEILATLSGGGHGKRVSTEEMERGGWRLVPERYMPADEEPGEYARLGDIVAITRGAMMGTREFEALSGGEPAYSVINYADISDGLLSDGLGRISKLPPKYLDCLLRDGDIVISKIGDTPRSAVIRGIGDTKMIPSANFYIIRITKPGFDPYYLKAYLESARGQKALAMLSTGTAIKTLSASALKELRVPLAPEEEMRKTAENYRAAEDELHAVKAREKEIKAAMSSLFDRK